MSFRMPAAGDAGAARIEASWRAFAARALHVAVGVATLFASVAPAFANDLSNYPCTAGDVEIVGNGIVVNEPCVCPPGGTFDAVVQFTVRNTTSTGRYCIAIHLVPDGVVLTQPLDVIMRDANGSSTALGKSGSEPYHDTVMYATIPNFSCDIGSVCFGSPGVTTGKCEPGKCTTISWNTSPGQAGCTTPDQSPPGGQCRHQQVCVIGFGASLACTNNCTTTCEGTSTLQACVSGPLDRAPYTLDLVGDDGSVHSQSTFGDSSGVVCLNFNVSPGLSPTTTYTLTVTDNQGCTRTDTASLEVRKNPVAAAGLDQMLCTTGTTTNFTLAGTATNGTGAWSVVSGPVTVADPANMSSGATFTGTGTATLRLTVSNPPCPSQTDDVVLTVNALATANAGPDQAKCPTGPTTSFTLAGSASGGTAVWSVLNGPAVIDNPGSLTSGVTFTGTGTATLRLTTTSNATPACETATDDIVLTVNDLPTANAGPDEAKCTTGATTSFTLAGAASGGTATWSVVSGPAVIDAPGSLTSGVTFTGTGTATLRLTTTSTATPACDSATDEVVLTVNALPTANAGPDQAKCPTGATTDFTLAGTASGGTSVWSVVGGPVVIGDPGSLTSGVTFTGTGTATLRLTTTSNATPPCETATDDIILTVNAVPTANAGPDQAKCTAGATTNFTLAGAATNGTATWSVVSGPAVIADPGSPTSGVVFTGAGKATLRLTTTSNATPQCTAATDEVVLTVVPTVVQISAPSWGCNGVATFTANVVDGADCDFVWTIDGQSLADFAAGGAAFDARVAQSSGPHHQTLEFRALDNTTHVITSTATCSSVAGSCTGSMSTKFQQCVGDAAEGLQERKAPGNR